MPIYLRTFYLRALNKQHEKEQEAVEKAQKGKSPRKGINRPTFSKSNRSWYLYKTNLV